MDREHILKRLRFRAWHRGMREADYLIGGFFDACADGWDDAGVAWFEALLEEQDADVMAWATGRAPVPDHLRGPMLDRFLRLDFVSI